MRIARRTLGLETCDVEILRVAREGDTVLVERVDRLRRADGSLIAAAPVVGVMTFSGDRVVHWREYFDSAQFVAQALRTTVLHFAASIYNTTRQVVWVFATLPPR